MPGPPCTRAEFDPGLALLAQGHSLRQVNLARRRPDRATWVLWRKRDPAFEDAYQTAIAAGKLHRLWNDPRRKHTRADFDRGLSRMRDGESLAQVAGVDGIPPLGSWHTIRKLDPAFDAEVRAAILAAAEAAGRVLEMTPELRARVLKLFREGHSARQISDLPGMPYRSTLLRLRENEPEFDQAVRDAWKWQDSHRTIYTSNQYAEAAQKVAAGVTLPELRSLGLPCAQALRKRALKDATFAGQFDAAKVKGRWRPNRAGGGHKRFQAGDFEHALRALQNGDSIAMLQQRGLMTRETLRRFGQANPEFQERLSRALEIYRPAFDTGSQLRAQLSQNDLWSAANAAVSRGLPTFIRDDVINEMIADAIQGDLDPADFKLAAREYVSDMMRGDGGGRLRSLDQDLHGDDGRTLHDVVESW